MLDEPAAGLNPKETKELDELIAELRNHHNTTILLIEHDMKLVMGISDRILVLCEGAMRGEMSREHANESNLLQMALPRQRADGQGN